MSPFENRFVNLAREHLDLGRDLDWDLKFSESDISSVDIVAFIILVGDEFGIEIPAEDLTEIDTMRSLASYIEGRAG